MPISCIITSLMRVRDELCKYSPASIHARELKLSVHVNHVTRELVYAAALPTKRAHCVVNRETMKPRIGQLTANG